MPGLGAPRNASQRIGHRELTSEVTRVTSFSDEGLEKGHYFCFNMKDKTDKQQNCSYKKKILQRADI